MLNPKKTPTCLSNTANPKIPISLPNCATIINPNPKTNIKTASLHIDPVQK